MYCSKFGSWFPSLIYGDHFCNLLVYLFSDLAGLFSWSLFPLCFTFCWCCSSEGEDECAHNHPRMTVLFVRISLWSHLPHWGSYSAGSGHCLLGDWCIVSQQCSVCKLFSSLSQLNLGPFAWVVLEVCSRPRNTLFSCLFGPLWSTTWSMV